jgi:MFS family permease
MAALARSRWVVAAAGTALMACLGTVYGWSLFAEPLRAAYGWSASATTLAFSVAIFFLGVGAVVGGRWQDRAGPRPVAVTGALLWAAGNLLAGLGTARLGAPWLWFSYGAVGGLGLGLGYVTPVAAVTKWFPERRGLGSGLVVMGFGLGAFFYSHAMKGLAPGAVPGAFLRSGLAFAVLGGLAAALVRDPPARAPAASAPPAPDDFAPREMLRRPQFYALWGMLFLNVTAGILFISNAVPIMRERTGVAAATAASVYGLIALANGLGRLAWGAISDRIGRRAAWALIYLIQVFAFLAVARAGELWLVAALFALVLLCYGGGFGTMPSFVADWFGTRHLGVNYGWVLLAWSAAGLAGPVFVAWVKDRTGTYAGALPVTAAMLAAATVLPLLARRPRPPGAAA